MLLFMQWSKNRFVLHVVAVMMDAQLVNTNSSPLFDPQRRDDKVIVFKYKKKKKYQRKLGHRQVCFQLHSQFRRKGGNIMINTELHFAFQTPEPTE